jgi:O-antigen/teichoic acid export membrane protein
MSFSGYVLASSITDILIYSIDRAVLAGFRNAATVGLYEAVSRPQSLVRQIQSALASTVFPASTQYVARGERDRQRQLLLRGTRYVVAATAPVVVVFMALAGPILTVWLGARYEPAATALAIFVSYWLVGASMGVAGSMLFTAGRQRAMAGYAWAVALVNLALSIALTAWLGLDGVVLGTTLSYLILFPYVIHVAVDTFDVTWGDFAREVWLPAYSLAALVGAALVAVRLAVDVNGAAEVIPLAAGGIAAYWLLYWVIWLSHDERTFFRGLLKRGA